MVEDHDLRRAAAPADLVCDVAPHERCLASVGERGAQPRREVRARIVAREDPCRDQHGVAIRAARVVGILVGVDLRAARACVLDQLDRRALVPPVRLALRLDVRSDDGRAGALADLDRLEHRIDQVRRRIRFPARPVPHRVRPFGALVRNVDAPARRDLADKRDELVRRAPPPGHVLQPGRDAPRPFVECLPHERAHPAPRAGRCTSLPSTRRRTSPCPTSRIAFGPMPSRTTAARCSPIGHGERPS
jgi:hypothetical protein